MSKYYRRWRLCYWKYWRKINFNDIPITITMGLKLDSNSGEITSKEISNIINDVENFNPIATSELSQASKRKSLSANNKDVNEILSQMKAEISQLTEKEIESMRKMSEWEQKENDSSMKISHLSLLLHEQASEINDIKQLISQLQAK